MNRQIFLDMDGVLVSLHAPIYRELDIHDPSVMQRWNNGDHDIPQSWWDGKDQQFWENLDWHDDGHSILYMLEGLIGWTNIRLCSTPANAASAAGKIEWIKNYIPRYERKLILTADKAACANPRTLLIDDSDKNCAAFKKAGGHSLLVPRIWNEGYPCDNVPAFIERRVKEMLDGD